MPAAAAADVNAKLARKRSESALECADRARGDARGMPVHSHDRAERLEPERICEAAQQLVAAVMMHDGLADDGTKPGHTVGKPFGRLSTVQRQVGSSGSAW